MSDVPMEYLLAAAIVAAGGTVELKLEHINDPGLPGKQIGIEFVDDETIRLELVDNGN